MNGDALRARLAAIAAEPDDGRVAYGADVLEVLDVSPIPAAVLVPVVIGPVPGILLTKRNAHLANHAGQVSFPGGRMDPGETPEAAALREAEEEVALDRRHVEVLGRMADHVTGTGFRITPILSVLPPGLELRPSPEEVELGVRAAAGGVARPGGAAAPAPAGARPLAGILGLAASRAFHLGRHRRDPEAPGGEAARGGVVPAAPEGRFVAVFEPVRCPCVRVGVGVGAVVVGAASSVASQRAVQRLSRCSQFLHGQRAPQETQ